MWTSSSTTSNFPPCHINHINNNNNNPKTMEEVWKDITTLPHPHPTTRGVILQDFFCKDPLPTAVSSPPQPPPPPPTLLTLSSSVPHPHIQHQSSVHDHVMNVSFDDLVPPPPDGNNGAGKKRFPESERNSGDRRHKRMIKNRESAARSRARKQAYTNELELEVAHLLEENARLKEQQQQMYIAVEAAQHQKRKCLQRASTAPFCHISGSLPYLN